MDKKLFKIALRSMSNDSDIVKFILNVEKEYGDLGLNYDELVSMLGFTTKGEDNTSLAFNMYLEEKYSKTLKSIEKLSGEEELPTSFLEKYWNVLDYKKFTNKTIFNIPLDKIKTMDSDNWDHITSHIWKIISYREDLTEDFIIKFKDKLDFSTICLNYKFSLDTIEAIEDKMHWVNYVRTWYGMEHMKLVSEVYEEEIKKAYENIHSAKTDNIEKSIETHNEVRKISLMKNSLIGVFNSLKEEGTEDEFFNIGEYGDDFESKFYLFLQYHSIENMLKDNTENNEELVKHKEEIKEKIKDLL